MPMITDPGRRSSGPRPIREASSSCVNFSRFLKALNAALSTRAEAARRNAFPGDSATLVSLGKVPGGHISAGFGHWIYPP